MEPVSVRIERMDLATLPRMPAQGEDQLIGYPGRMNAGDKTLSKGVKNERRGSLKITRSNRPNHFRLHPRSRSLTPSLDDLP